MDCIVYIDLFFLLNLWMNILILFLVRKITKTYRTFYCLLSALIGALGSTGLLLGFFLTEWRWLFLLHIPFIILMNGLAFGAVSLLWRLCLFFLTGALIAGAQLAAVSITGMEGSTGTVAMVSAAAVIAGIALERQCRIRWKEEHMKAKTVLEFEDRKMFATALMDTGNRLYDPFYHKPVILVDERMMKDIMLRCRECFPEKLQYIPYHSIGKSNGMLEGVMLDSVSIQWQEKRLQFHKVIAAAAKETLYKGKEYQVIFHCGLLEEI